MAEGLPANHARWNSTRLLITFFAVVWALPFVAALVGAALAGDCDIEVGSCSSAQSFGTFLLFAIAFFWIFVAAPLTVVIGAVWAIRKVVGKVRREHERPREATSEREAAGVSTGHMWIFAAVLWWLVFVGIAMVSTADDASYPGLAAAVFGAIVAVPLTLFLGIDWLARRRSRNRSGRQPGRAPGSRA